MMDKFAKKNIKLFEDNLDFWKLILEENESLFSMKSDIKPKKDEET